MKIKLSLSILIVFILAGCYGVNSETSEIGTYYWICLDNKDVQDIIKAHSPDKITDPVFIDGLKEVNNHFLKPEYVIYFDKAPKEIVGFDGYSIRVAYNPDISHQAVNGLSPQLTDAEQVRIRNRVIKLMWEKECDEGKRRLEEYMEEPAVYSKEYYDSH